MRSKHRRSGRHGRGSTSEQKSVFDRLGRQVEAQQQQLKRQSAMSPGQYGDYGMPPPPPPPLSHQAGPMHGPEFPRHPREAEAEMEWRYHERRQMAAAYARERQPGQLGPPPPSDPAYDMDLPMGPPYHSISHPYHGQPGGPPPPLPPPPVQTQQMGHGQRESPKYDRHGNPILLPYRDREGAQMRPPMMEPPPGSLIGPGGIMLPEVPPMRAGQRGWYGPEPYGPGYGAHMLAPQYPMRMLPEDAPYSPLSSRRYPQVPPPPPPISMEGTFTSGSDAPRYIKWRERRDAITNLDRETAQSSSRTDSLKSSLQQVDGGRVTLKSDRSTENKPALADDRSLSTKENSTDVVKVKKEPNQEGDMSNPQQEEKGSKLGPCDNQDISDGEIVDDEDSDSDDSEVMTAPVMRSGSTRQLDRQLTDIHTIASPIDQTSYLRRATKESHFGREFFPEAQPAAKKRRHHEREEYMLDYETISDDDKDLEDIMAEKELGPAGDGASESLAEGSGSGGLASTIDDSEISGSKKSSEIELLNALGLDWANLVEIAKQSRASNSSTSGAPGSALARFSMPNYLRTLEISPELAGPKLYEMINRVCRV